MAQKFPLRGTPDQAAIAWAECTAVMTALVAQVHPARASWSAVMAMFQAPESSADGGRLMLDFADDPLVDKILAELEKGPATGSVWQQVRARVSTRAEARERTQGD